MRFIEERGCSHRGDAVAARRFLGDIDALKNLGHATVVNLAGCELSPMALHELARVLPEAPMVSELWLDNNLVFIGINDSHSRGFVSAITTLRVLSIPSTGLRGIHMDGLGTALEGSAVESLDIGFNPGITSHTMCHLTRHLPRTVLTRLVLSGSVVGTAGGIALGDVIPLCVVEVLEISDCELTTAGAVALAKAIPRSRLRSLNVNHNPIGDEGVLAIFDGVNAPGCVLESLYATVVMRPETGTACMRSLIRSKERPHRRTLRNLFMCAHRDWRIFKDVYKTDLLEFFANPDPRSEEDRVRIADLVGSIPVHQQLTAFLTARVVEMAQSPLELFLRHAGGGLTKLIASYLLGKKVRRVDASWGVPM